jgi:hypothetical protein
MKLKHFSEGGGKFMWPQPPSCADAGKLCLGEDQRILVDGGRMASYAQEQGIRLFPQHDGCVAVVMSSRGTSVIFLGVMGTLPTLYSGANAP